MLKKILCGATLLCAATFTNAASISYSVSVGIADTDYDTTVLLPFFDDNMGTMMLDSVTFSIDGTLRGGAEVENRSTSSATTIVTNRQAQLTLTDALMNTLVVTIPTITNTFNATIFDGTLDFGGTSGITYPISDTMQYEEATYTDAPTLLAFTGMGDASFGFEALGTCSFTAGGNVLAGFTTQAGGEVTVTYEYSAVPVSAPSQVAFLGLGLLAFAGLRKALK